MRTDDVMLRQFVPVPWSPQDTRLYFKRADSGDITGLILSCDMARGIIFEKRL